jgi:hypothetical protein
VTQEAEKRRMVVEASQGKGFRRSYIEKTHQIRASRVVQGVGPEFKPQYYKNIKNKIKIKREKRGKTVRRNITIK